MCVCDSGGVSSDQGVACLELEGVSADLEVSSDTGGGVG